MHILNEIRLLRFVDSQRGRPFQWGFRDCNTLALHILDMLTGVRYAQKVCGRYKTELGAARFFQGFGLDWPGVLRKQGAVEVKPGFERLGDFLIVDMKKWQACHVCLGERAVTVTLKRGVEIVPLAALEKYRIFRLPAGAGLRPVSAKKCPLAVGATPASPLQAKARMSA
ncbi:MAG: hypothetical protein SVS15_04845 [Thermodesulfobacteriota bacterium]|nr:hypothetical protein [Thermodesulfobacteriota bacterium]